MIVIMEKILILILFIITYIGIILFQKYKLSIIGISALVMTSICLGFKSFTLGELFSSLDYNILLMLIGIMIISDLFSDSNMPNKLADKMISKMPNTLGAIVFLVALSGIISAFMDNVATVLMLAPIGLMVAKKTNTSPIPIIIGIAISSNLQGAATLIGDTTSIMLSSTANMSFFDFFFINGRFSIFWAVELGALFTLPIIAFLFRKNNNKLEYQIEDIKIKSIVPSLLLILVTVCLICTSFIENKFFLLNGLICLGIGIMGLIYDRYKFNHKPLDIIKRGVDFETIGFLFFLFIIIKCVESVGIINNIGNIFTKVGDKNIFLLFTLIVFGSMIISAFIDNIPYVATMLPIITILNSNLPSISPYLLYFGLLIGATLGGNLTPIGASANVVGVGILKKEGYEVKNKDFFKIGIPFTLTSIIVGYLFVWLIWGI